MIDLLNFKIYQELDDNFNKRYVDEIFIYNKKNPYFPTDFDQPSPINNDDTINNIFTFTKDKSP